MKHWFCASYGLRDWCRHTLWTLGIVGVIFGFLGGVFFVDYRIQSRNCGEKAQQMHMPGHRYDFWAATCFVQLPDGRSVDIDSVRFNEQGQVSS